jgi:hypothetical protein
MRVALTSPGLGLILLLGATLGGPVLGLGGAATAQPPAPRQETAAELPQAPPSKDGTHPLPLLRTPSAVSPWQTFQHLRRGNALLIEAGAGTAVPPQPRSYGFGDRIAAVVVPAGLRLSAATLFAVRHSDLLVMSSPGSLVRNEEVAMVERAVTGKQVSLLVILVDRDDPLGGDDDPTPTFAGKSLQRPRAAARALAQLDRLTVPAAHGILQADGVWLRSALLEETRLQGRFQIAVGLVSSKTGAIDWVTRWHQRWQLLSSASAAARLRVHRAELARAKVRARRAAKADPEPGPPPTPGAHGAEPHPAPTEAPKQPGGH